MPFPFLLASVDLWAAFIESGPFGQFIIAILFGFSVYVTYRALLKYADLSKIKRQNKRFRQITESDGTWEKLYQESNRYKGSPLARLLHETYVTCSLEKWFSNPRDLPVQDRVEIASATIAGVISRILSEEEERLQKTINLLAMTAAIAPFVGLFGTVVGVLGAFQGLGREGAANLTSLAPGVATALMTTVAGLLLAIPAALLHHKFAADVNREMAQMERFGNDLDDAVRKKILTESSGRGARSA